ncbi:olfactory receptor 5AR1-like [Alligator mississippiensis]|uniref:olfactory receptor 5AR1-like n=1 Tax=Alligator mississippiensis TaxID=8496 RepID=UPI0003D08418|nr:olfactory receptor 5AR1-like [Alligator mississippiensis]
MAEGNHTEATEFLLLGFTGNPKLEMFLFVFFLFIYMVILLGNLGMVILIRIDSQLHTPMYFFISNLAFLDVGISTIVAPKMLMTLRATRKTISFTGCGVQSFLFCVVVTCECCLLAVMAYDRFVAICSPLFYPVIMSKWFCMLLVLASHLVSYLYAIIQTITIFRLSFCHSNTINHFFCDTPPLLKLSCSNTYIPDTVHFIWCTLTVASTTLIIFISYIHILVAILRISSAQGRHKAFFTCASHLTAVTIFYGTGSFMYLRLSSKHTMDQDKIISVFYTFAIPMVNPMIYSLRNKVKEAFKRTLKRKFYSQ